MSDLSIPRDAVEVNFDGLVGPTHSYAGLSHGNLASIANRATVSSPRQAALQGLAKMKFMMDLGIRQAVLPPQPRPHVRALRALGFVGSDAQIVEKAFSEDPTLLAAVMSSSSMWAANAATVSPSSDALDGRVHFTPANLVSHFHRALEAPTTGAILKAIFRDSSAFVHHDPLPGATRFSDEGAANHTRLAASHGSLGLELFTYGRVAGDASLPQPKKYPARQTLESGQAIARLHRLDTARTFHVRQNPDAIDTGAFHNDVVSVGNENVLLCHSLALPDPEPILGAIARAFAEVSADDRLYLIGVDNELVPLADAVSSYLLNSQLVTLPGSGAKRMALIAPIECRENSRVQEFLKRMLEMETPVREVHYVDVRQSMQNGGGPACLRLRVVLTADEIAKTLPEIFLTPALYDRLVTWVNRHYRDHLSSDDLADPHLMDESRSALEELSRILNLGSVFDL